MQRSTTCGRARTVSACVVAFALVTARSVQASAGIIFVSQQRSVSASALGSSQSFDAPDFGPFNRSAFATSTMGQGSSGQASQQSVLGPALVSLSGSTSAHGTSGFGYSSFNVVFDVEDALAVELTGVGSGSISGTPSLQSSISLKRDADTLVQWQASMGTPDVLGFSGELEPGRYTLNAAFSAANAPGFTATNSYWMTLQAPDPAGATGTVAAIILILRRRTRKRNAEKERGKGTRKRNAEKGSRGALSRPSD